MGECRDCLYFKIPEDGDYPQSIMEALNGRGVCDLNGMMRYRNEQCDKWCDKK